MSLAAGEKLGPYEIVAPIGAGGMSPEGKLMAVEVGAVAAKDRPPFPAGSTKVLFDSIRPGPVPDFPYWDFTADGQRFLTIRPETEDSTSPITVVTNWTVLLKK